MKKKLDVDKFFKILSKPKKKKKLIHHNFYSNSFGLDTKTHFFELPDYHEALADLGCDNLTKMNEGYAEERRILSEFDEISDDFKHLDKSINYTPIFQVRDTPDPDDGVYFMQQEAGYLSSSKSKYSFLLWSENYNMNFYQPEIINVYANIKKKDIKDFSKISFNLYKSQALGKNTHYCKFIFLNNAYQWCSDKEHKELITKKNFPQSLKDFFLPAVENKMKFAKECGHKPSDIKKINSLVAIINEKKIKNKSFFPYKTKLGKGEIWALIK